jgi:hypothetical protein
MIVDSTPSRQRMITAESTLTEGATTPDRKVLAYTEATRMQGEAYDQNNCI